MKERDCTNCKHHTSDGCSKWDCKFEAKDLISRADAIKAVEQEYRIDRGYMVDDYTYGFNQAIHYVSDIILPDLPSADAVQGWIPCTERLPSESDDYLCTIPLDADETYTEVLTFHKGRFYEDDDEWGATYHDDVLAWQPLPTPYKGGAE